MATYHDQMTAEEIEAERCVGFSARLKAIEAFRDSHSDDGAPATQETRASGWVVSVTVRREGRR